MKTTLLVLFLTSIGLLAQQFAPAPTASATNDPSALRRALRRSIAGETNAPTAQPAAPSTLVTAPATAEIETVPPDTNVTATVPAPTVTPVEVTPAAPSTEAQPLPDASAPPGFPSTPQTPQPGQARAIPGKPAVPPAQAEDVIPPGQINFAAAELNQVLTLYAEWVNRTILRSPNLAAPPIVLKTQTPLTKSEAIQVLDAVLAMNGIAMINIGEKFVKAVPILQADQEGAARDTRDVSELPDLGQYVTHIVQLKTAKPSELAPVLQAFGKTKSILAVDSSQILIIRDYAENVKRMLEMIAEIDVATPSEFISEVIPIKYALAGDIASALNSLSGTGGGGTSVGSSTSRGGSTAPRSTAARPGALGYQPGQQQPGVPTAAGTPSSGASFSDRLQSIIRRASTSGDVQVLGSTKIIADERTNSLLIFATKADMAMIKDIVSKLDVVLAQVLIEAIIMEVSLDDSKSLGISYLQHNKTVGSVGGVGAIKTTPFLTPANFLSGLSNSANALPSGFSYFARIGDDLDVTLQAIAGDGRVNVLSRPRIQTSHAVPASLFIGNTVPYIQGTTYGDFSGASSRSVYQERQVGITLDVLPLINPDGLVVMDIQQDIEQLGTPTTIDGNSVPTTTKRSASAKVAVKDGDTIILGGFISTTRSTSKSGVPFLKDIPLLGYLFRSTSANNQRVELIVLLRPTVLPTPEAAAKVAKSEKNLMPGVRRAEAEIRDAESKAIRKADSKQLDQ